VISRFIATVSLILPLSAWGFSDDAGRKAVIELRERLSTLNQQFIVLSSRGDLFRQVPNEDTAFNEKSLPVDCGDREAREAVTDLRIRILELERQIGIQSKRFIETGTRCLLKPLFPVSDDELRTSILDLRIRFEDVRRLAQTAWFHERTRKGQSVVTEPIKSPFPPCGPSRYWHSCFGSLKNQSTGEMYVGEWRNDKRHGYGIEYKLDGSVNRSGEWAENRFLQSLPLDPFLFPSFKGEGVTPPSEAERKKGQDLEIQLAKAKEHQGQQAQAPQPQRPQVALRNERRLALVVGNSSYKVSPLDNPANDANDVAESLKKFGFQTTLVRNATLGQMREATRKFADQLPSADVALIYFAGHGIESNRKNYMIPVNADLKFEYELADQGYDAGIWLEMLESIKSNNADRVNIVILDACRNNSLIGSRNLGRGLGKMDAPSGTFLAYSTAPGKVAADGGRGERNSPFTKHLIRAMQQPNQPIEEVFKEVRRNVGKETNGAQVPWESTSLTGFFTFRQAR